MRYLLPLLILALLLFFAYFFISAPYMKYVVIALAALLGVAVLYYLVLLSIPVLGGKDAGTPIAPVATPPRENHNGVTARFVHREVPAFSFSYPQFENWETESTDRSIRYEPHESLGVVLSQPLTVTFDFVAFAQTEPFMADATKNPQGVPYKKLGSEDGGKTTRVIFDIAHPGGVLLDMSIPMSETRGDFEGSIITQTIIETLKKQ